MMRLWHVTPRKNLRRIVAEGILPTKSRGARLVVWLCTGARLAWALLHIADHHRLHPTGLVAVRVSVDRALLRRTGRPGIFTTAAPVTRMEVIRGIFTPVRGGRPCRRSPA